jgi:excisionase family DNA binding protein
MMEKPANDGRPQRNASPALRFLTIGEIANCLDVSTRTVRRWIKSRALLAHPDRGHRADLGGGLSRQGELMFEKNILGKAPHINQRMS